MIDLQVCRNKVSEVLATLLSLYPEGMSGTWTCRSGTVRFHWFPGGYFNGGGTDGGMSYSFSWWDNPIPLGVLSPSKLLLVMEHLADLAHFVEKRDLRFRPVPVLPTKQDVEFQRRCVDAVMQADNLIIWMSKND